MANPRLCSWAFAGIVSIIAVTDGGSAVAQEPSASEQLFALKVQPLLREKCLPCHGDDPETLEGGFDLRTREAMLRGGDSFGNEVLVPGKAADSFLLALVKRTEPDYEMPPKEADKLTQEQVWWIRDWINGGAPWPDQERVAMIYERFAAGVTVKTSGGLSDEWTKRKYKPEDLWAYQPYWTDAEGRLQRDKRSPVDLLIGDRIAGKGLAAAPRADRRTLIRRATFDLLGLPPRPDEIEQFLADKRDDRQAFATLVDRLLESPQYGEQWGRHWLDVVRYADSSGFANDWERPNAWRYRDYVIRSFNEDKPYDAFIREQIAGDEFDPGDPEMLVAVGFLRMGPWEHTGMSVAKVTRQQFLDDITDAVGQVFLAQALQCCRCHDHKFDPIPTRDYYSVQAVFSTTQFAELNAPWLLEENREGMDEEQRFLERRRKLNEQMMAELTKMKQDNHRHWFEQRGLPYKTRQEAIKAGAAKDDIPPMNALMTPDEFGRERIGRKWRSRISWELDRFRPIAFSVYNGKTRMPKNSSAPTRKPANPLGQGTLEKTTILKGGSAFSPSEPVSPGVLSAVPGGLDHHVPTTVDRRRSALARWLASPNNPLTARVMVNRVWQYHFGRGIAGNPNNFGTTGKKPTHPKLLDWLATEFMEEGWSVKHLHRVMMNSDAYCRSTTHPDPKSLAELDPANRLYAVYEPRRLTAEELRDAMLAATGELNLLMGGIPARPDMNLEAALQPRMIMGTFAPSYVPQPRPEQRNRRTVYALKLRGHRDPFMETFNQPPSERSCELRDTSTVTPQALMLLNSEEVADRALALAARAVKKTDSDEAAIDYIFRRVYGRPAEAKERSEAIAHWRQMEAVEAQIKYEPREFPTKVVRQANEENTGETFSFTESLFVYEDYVPDLQPHQVTAKVRGLSDLCLAILNSNEFVYVY